MGYQYGVLIGCLGRMILHLSPTCLTLGYGCIGLHDVAFAAHLSRARLPLSPTMLLLRWATWFCTSLHPTPSLKQFSGFLQKGRVLGMEAFPLSPLVSCLFAACHCCGCLGLQPAFLPSHAVALFLMLSFLRSHGGQQFGAWYSISSRLGSTVFFFNGDSIQING